MEYRIDDTYEWDEEASDLRVAGESHRVCVDASWSPRKVQRIGEVTRAGHGAPRKGEPKLHVGDHMVRVRPYKPKTSPFRRRVGWVHVTSDAPDPEGSLPQEGFLKVVAVRKAAVIALVVAILAALLLLVSLLTGVEPQWVPTYLADQTGISSDDSKPTATVSYATYESTPDTTWKAGTTEQDVTLRLPATVTYADSDGNQQTTDNPVVAAPSIWVDFNGDGDFSKDECVFNPPAYDKDGNVTDPGQLLEPGKEISHVTLTRTIPAGTYKAMTLWTPRMADGGAPANPMTFQWNLTVQ